MDRKGSINLFMLILLVAIVISVLLIFVFAIDNMTQTATASLITDENFIVSDPSVNKDCTTAHTLVVLYSVEYHNGTSWKTLSSGDYMVSGNTVTVKASAMS